MKPFESKVEFARMKALENSRELFKKSIEFG